MRREKLVREKYQADCEVKTTAPITVDLGDTLSVSGLYSATQDTVTNAPKPDAASSYTPAVGDVVEYRLDSETGRGIVFCDRSHVELCLECEDGEWFHDCEKQITRLISRTNVMDGIDAREDAKPIAEAYFAKEAEPEPSVEYKVGDLVEVVSRDGDIGHGHDIGDIGLVTYIPNDYSAFVKPNQKVGQTVSLSDLRPLSGTYAERQAKWVEFHGLKVGDKVKVVRGYKDYEDDWGCTGIDNGSSFVGITGVIKTIDNDSIGIYNENGGITVWHPYFALEPITK